MTLFKSSMFRCVPVAFVIAIFLFTSSTQCGGVAYAQNTAPRDAASSDAKNTLKKFRIDLIPNDALGVIAFRPAQILAQKIMKPARDLFIQDARKHEIEGLLGLNPLEIESMTVIFFMPGQEHRENFAMVIQTKQKIDRKLVTKKFSSTKPVDSKIIGKNYLKVSVPSGKSLLFLDDQTLVTSKSEKAIQQVIDTLQQNEPNHWARQWQGIEKASVAGILNVRLARTIIGKQAASQIVMRMPPQLAPMLSIWENTDVATFGLTVNQKVSLEFTLYQKKNGESVKNAVDSGLTFLANTLNQMQQKMNQNNAPAQWVSLMTLYMKIIKSIEVTQKGEDVSLTSLLPDDSGTKMIAMLGPAIIQAREAARRSLAKNNLKMLGLALHNYHDAHSQFPPAIVIGPDGKTPHSWRVELLPYLDQADLYKEYNMNEPWDSEHNKKVLSKMPAVFRNPNDDGAANNASYFAVVGKNTLFGKKEGARIRDIIDGTSNTIMIVEAKRNIPWTKPEDIQYDGKKVPKFGGFHQGGFYVLRCDGGVSFISEFVDKDHLKNLLEINDGNAVP